MTQTHEMRIGLSVAQRLLLRAMSETSPEHMARLALMASNRILESANVSHPLTGPAFCLNCNRAMKQIDPEFLGNCSTICREAWKAKS